MGTLRTLVIGCSAHVNAMLKETLHYLRLSAPTISSPPDQILKHLEDPDYKLVLFDVGCAEEVLSVLPAANPATRFVLVGERLPTRAAFDYAHRGVDAWIDSLPDVATAIRHLEDVLSGPSALQRVANAHLGRYGLKDAQHSVRQSMITEALRRTGGSRHAAARLLRVDRRAVQLALKEIEEDRGASPRRATGILRKVQDDLARKMDDRVHKHSEHVVAWRELPVQTVGTVRAAFGHITAFARAAPLHLVIDLTEARYPDRDVRASLREHFTQLEHLRGVSIAIGDNKELELAARVVLANTAACPISVHSSFESALHDAARATRRWA